jgi:hypothetical protein
MTLTSFLLIAQRTAIVGDASLSRSNKHCGSLQQHNTHWHATTVWMTRSCWNCCETIARIDSIAWCHPGSSLHSIGISVDLAMWPLYCTNRIVGLRITSTQVDRQCGATCGGLYSIDNASLPNVALENPGCLLICTIKRANAYMGNMSTLSATRLRCCCSQSTWKRSTLLTDEIWIMHGMMIWSVDCCTTKMSSCSISDIITSNGGAGCRSCHSVAMTCLLKIPKRIIESYSGNPEASDAIAPVSERAWTVCDSPVCQPTSNHCVRYIR